MIFAKLHEAVLLVVVFSILLLLYWYLLYMTFVFKKLYSIICRKRISLCNNSLSFRFSKCIYTYQHCSGADLAIVFIVHYHLVIRNLYQLEVFYICSSEIVHVHADKQKSLQVSYACFQSSEEV